MSMSSVLWFTGLSASGKSTIAHALAVQLTSLGKTVSTIDGDEIRRGAHKHLGFTPADIKENNRRIVELAKERLVKSDIVLVSIISPYAESRRKARLRIGPGFLEIFVHASERTRLMRDPKGLYKKAKGGELKRLIGYHAEAPYEAPLAPDLVLDTDEASIEESVSQLLGFLKMKKVV